MPQKANKNEAVKEPTADEQLAMMRLMNARMGGKENITES